LVRGVEEPIPSHGTAFREHIELRNRSDGVVTLYNLSFPMTCDDATVLVREKSVHFCDYFCDFLALRDFCAAVVLFIGSFVCTYSYVQLQARAGILKRYR